MPKDIELFNQHIQAEKGSEQDPDGPPGAMREIWILTFTDKTYGDRIKIRFQRPTRDHLVSQLTSGVVIAGGELPKL